VSGDDASVLDKLNLGSFRGESAAIGLAILFKPTIGRKDVSFILKWVHDIYAKRRFGERDPVIHGVQVVR
jgi:hypothetical protein